MSAPTLNQTSLDDARATVARIRAAVGRVFVGQDDLIELLVLAFLARGHVLIEGVPGTGKTLLVRALAQALNLSFSRIQFTIDLMPADVTGTRMLLEEHGQRRFEFVAGPLFAHVVLADEINRATPKTQSALLEAMAELQCTVAGTTHPLARPFFVLATLNPIEMEGTFPLPEAQLDRFFFKLALPYPDQGQLRRILSATTGSEIPNVEPVFDAAEAAHRIVALQQLVPQVLVAPPVEEYAAALVRATVPRSSKLAPRDDAPLAPSENIERYVSFGASPRGGQALLLGGKARALLDGRVNLSFDDIDAVAVAALSHRLVLNYAAIADRIDPRDLISQLVTRAHEQRA